MVHEREVRDAAAGMAAGLAATALMTLFTRSVSIQQEGMIESPEGESPADKAAGKISRAVLGRPLRGKAHDRGGRLLHYAFGALAGALYGGLAPAGRARPWLEIGRASCRERV